MKFKVKAALTPTRATAAAVMITHLGIPRASAIQHPEEDFFLQQPDSLPATGQPAGAQLSSDLQHFPAINNIPRESYAQILSLFNI
jgi:hypothetical protein